MRFRIGWTYEAAVDGSPVARLFMHGEGHTAHERPNWSDIRWYDWRDSENDCLDMDVPLIVLEAGCWLDTCYTTFIPPFQGVTTRGTPGRVQKYMYPLDKLREYVNHPH